MPLIDPGPIQFRATLLRSDSSGAACFVMFPHDLKATYGKGNLVPVHARWDGRVDYRGSLAMMGGDSAMLLCRKDVVAQLGKMPGDEVDVVVTLDTAPREVEVPEALSAALQADPAAARAWEAMSRSARQDYAWWIADAKKPETRDKRIATALPKIAAGQKLK